MASTTATDDPGVSEDERDIEFSSIAAIFPELVVEPIEGEERHAHLEIDVDLDAPVRFSFAPLLTKGEQTAHGNLRNGVSSSGLSPAGTDAGKLCVSLSHLPPLVCRISLPLAYPQNAAPKARLESSTPWLTGQKIHDLEKHAVTLWEQCGHDVMLYDYLDWLTQSARTAFDLPTSPSPDVWVVSKDLEASLLDFDLQAKRRKFAAETFNCGVCLEPKKGSACHRMSQCGHVFCVACLQDFYNNCITEGTVSNVKCLDPKCERDRLKNIPERRRKRVDLTIKPSELLEIPLEQEQVQRFVHLKQKQELESNRNVVFCPRRWCQGAARSEKKKKTLDDPDTASEDEESKNSSTSIFGDRLAICSQCSFAFCSRCLTGPWHGEHVGCRPPRNKEELSTEEIASAAYLKAHTARCPTCDAPVQKSMGCNHMICQLCKSHFCYLCQAYLMESNPYEHFNKPGQGCYMRLFVLEEGDDEFAPLVDNIPDDLFDAGFELDDNDRNNAANQNAAPVAANHAANGAARGAARIVPPAAQGDVLIEFVSDTESSSEENEVAPPGGWARERGRGAARRGRGAGRGGRGRRRGMGPGQNAAPIPAPLPPPVRGGGGDGGRGIARFVQMALRDQEDEWDSDELGSDSDGDWVIPVRGRVP